MKATSPYKFIVTAFFTSCFFLCACENNEADIANLNKKVLEVEKAKGVRTIFTLGGKTKAVLTAPLMLRVQDSIPYYEFPETLQCDFYNDSGTVESVLTAQYAKYRETQNIIFLKDSVKVINILKGDTLYCQELYWDRSRTNKEFYTDKAVRIRTRTQIIDGIGMEANQSFKDWLILKPIGTVQVPASKFPM